MKDYLLAENSRNHRNHKIYARLMKAALGECDVLVAHHLTFTTAGEEPNEIPSADTLIFDFMLMSKVFGNKAAGIVEHLAVQTPEVRDAYLEEYLNQLDLAESGVKFAEIT